MNSLRNALILILSVALTATLSYAKPKGAEPPKTDKPKKDANELIGTVLKIDDTKLVIQTHGKASSEVSVATDARTQFQVHDKPAAFKDIKPGMQVVITPMTGTAEKVVVAEDTKDQKKKDKEKKKKKDKKNSASPAPAGNGQQ
ncbi:MAG TPA: hypothetical protein VH475_30240 [Tepidisphaeraceae bacterium]|jgi:hypothetical protein